MGWDAYAVPFLGKQGQRQADPDFVEVAAEVVAAAGCVDGLLEYGGLDVSTCGEMLRLATKHSVYGDPWTAEQVQVLATVSNWDFKVDQEHEWAKASAKAFLERCAALNRGIEFTW